MQRTLDVSQSLGIEPDQAEVEAVEWTRMAEPTGEVHPVASLFPMMTDEELDDLAADIKANGLLHPIVLDEEGRLIDGRNRLSACLRADVAPEFSRLNGHDPVAFILSANVARRHLSKGQQAMAVARADSLTNNSSTRELASTIKASQKYVWQAIEVLRYAPALADAVLSGALSLSEAYEKARGEKLAAEGREALMARLQREAPDLATLVQEERLTLAEALAALEKRIREKREYTSLLTRQLSAALTALDPGSVDVEDSARTWLEADPSIVGEAGDFSPRRTRRIAAVLIRYAEMKEERDGQS